jgi:hypothetical protein
MTALGDNSSSASGGASSPLTPGTSCCFARGAMFQRNMILDFILFHKLQFIRGCVNQHPNGPRLCLLFTGQLGCLPFIRRQEDMVCAAPLGDNGSMGRGSR